MSTSVTVASIPTCDFNQAHGPAYADAHVPSAGGGWAFVCRTCFDHFGCQLGTGAGQVLVLSTPTSKGTS